MPIYTFEDFVPDVALITPELTEAFSSNYVGLTEDNRVTSFEFSNDLSAEDQDTLSDIVENHEHGNDEYVIYDLLPDDSPWQHLDQRYLPCDIDFKTALTTKLFPDWKKEKGAPTQVIYYRDSILLGQGNQSFSSPVVKIDFTFIRDSITLVQKKIRKIYWMDRSGNWSTDYKLMIEHPTKEQQIEEAEQRRKNIISALKVDTIGLLMYTGDGVTANPMTEEAAADLGRVFLSQYKPEIIDYIDEATDSFLNATQSASIVDYPWLENIVPGVGITIRQYIIAAIS